MNMSDAKVYDVIIIGGSYAGLSAALALGRSLRKVLVIDSGSPCNSQTPHSQNFLTQDGKSPIEIIMEAKNQLLKYNTLTFLKGLAVKGKKTVSGYAISTQNGEEFLSRKLIFASGLKDIMPDIKGFAECWGISAIHCPYCHGYEFRQQKTAIMAETEKAFHLAQLVNNLTGDLTLVISAKADFDEEQLRKLKKHNIKIIESEVEAIEHEKGYLNKIIFKDGKEENFDALYAALPFEQHSDIPTNLGCELTEYGHLKVDDFQRTTVEGIYACGDNTSRMRSVANAVANGNLTGAVVNMALTDEAF